MHSAVGIPCLEAGEDVNSAVENPPPTPNFKLGLRNAPGQ
jgi:hypothetical protein